MHLTAAAYDDSEDIQHNSKGIYPTDHWNSIFASCIAVVSFVGELAVAELYSHVYCSWTLPPAERGSLICLSQVFFHVFFLLHVLYSARWQIKVCFHSFTSTSTMNSFTSSFLTATWWTSPTGWVTSSTSTSTSAATQGSSASRSSRDPAHLRLLTCPHFVCFTRLSPGLLIYHIPSKSL